MIVMRRTAKTTLKFTMFYGERELRNRYYGFAMSWQEAKDEKGKEKIEHCSAIEFRGCHKIKALDNGKAMPTECCHICRSTAYANWLWS